MLNQQVLEDCIEKMGVWISKHPSGTLRVQHGAEAMMIFPHEKRWTYRITEIGLSQPYKTGFYTRKDVLKFVHMVQKWSWTK